MSTAALANPNGTNVPNIIPLEEGWNNEIKAKVRSKMWCTQTYMYDCYYKIYDNRTHKFWSFLLHWLIKI